MFDVAKVFINVADPNSGTDTFDAYVVEPLEQVLKQVDLSLIRRSKICVTAFRTVSHVVGSIPGEKRFAQTSTGRDHTDGTFRDGCPCIQRAHVICSQNGD